MHTSSPYFSGDSGGVFKTCSDLVDGVHTVIIYPSGQDPIEVTFQIDSYGTSAPTSVSTLTTAAPTFPLDPTATPVVPPTMPPVATPAPITQAPVSLPKDDGIVAVRLIYTGEGPLNNQPVVDLDFNSLTSVNVLGLGLSSTSFNIEAVNVGTINDSVGFAMGSFTRTERGMPYAYWYVQELLFQSLVATFFSEIAILQCA